MQQVWLTLTSNKLLSENHICLVEIRYVSGLRNFAMMGHGLVSTIGRYYCCAAYGDVRAERMTRVKYVEERTAH